MSIQSVLIGCLLFWTAIIWGASHILASSF